MSINSERLKRHVFLSAAQASLFLDHLETARTQQSALNLPNDEILGTINRLCLSFQPKRKGDKWYPYYFCHTIKDDSHVDKTDARVALWLATRAAGELDTQRVPLIEQFLSAYGEKKHFLADRVKQLGHDMQMMSDIICRLSDQAGTEDPTKESYDE